ncbi:unnamed protein product [Lactuca virosa]|uniref:Cleavage and polyadenylation specificity factor subunit 2 n=1 Tax=Lactuca virosa TaxID=75947 RepID=A0AAU9NQV1_9ASTR|nr:unnamed protein product [Lactuca virosa]
MDLFQLRVFPFYDDTSEWDDFGEVINPHDYVIKDEDMDMGSMAALLASLMLDTTPSKVVSSEVTVQVKYCLVYMDFEGRSDGRSMKSILETCFGTWIS